MIKKQLAIDNLKFQYGKHNQSHNYPVFDGISFSTQKGESVGIIGANGVGKSTLLKLLVGLLPEYEGSIKMDDIPVVNANLAQIRQKTGYVFQDSDSQLFMNTVYEDVAFGPRNYGMNEKEVDERVRDALTKAHIERLADRHIYKLSGGEKKLVAIATILSMGAEVLLMDEPSVALDPGNRENLIHILNELPGTKLIASHDLDFIYDTCERTILLNHGQIVADEDTKILLRNRKLLEENGLRLPLSFRFLDGI